PFDLRKLEFSGEAITVAPSVGFIAGSRRVGFTSSANGYLAYSEDTEPVSHVVWFDRHGDQIGTLGSPVDVENVRLSADEKQVVMDGSGDVWFSDLGRGAQSRVTFSE